MLKHSIMIVEDDPVSARVAEMVLAQLGYTVAGVFAAAEDALAAVRDRVPDLVLMDIMLAGEMDGVQAASLIRKKYGVPVIFLTSTTDEVIGRVGESGAWGYIHKPVKLLDLKANLEMALTRREAERRLARAEECRDVLDVLPLAVVLAGLDMRARWANPQAGEYLGLPAADMEGRPLDELLAALFPDLPRPLLPDLYQPGELSPVARDGRVWRLAFTPARKAGGVVASFRPGTRD